MTLQNPKNPHNEDILHSTQQVYAHGACGWIPRRVTQYLMTGYMTEQVTYQ